MRAYAVAAAVALIWPTSLFSQPVSLDDLARRVEALERENASLRAEVARLAGRGTETRMGPQAAAASSRPASAEGAEEPAAAPSWDGAYVGINGGVTEARYRYQSFDITPDQRASATGAAFGAQLGRRWQDGNLVAGLELEASFPLDQDANLSLGTSTLRSFDTRLNGRLKGQLGLALGRIMVYGTAGLQVSNIRFSSPRVPPAQGTTYRDGNAPGFLYGIGFAARISPSLSLEIEATEADLGLVPGTNTVSADNRAITVRLNQRFP